MTARLAHIRRHPIKSLGGEGLDSIALSAARRLPGDREWAVLTENGERHIDGEPDRWLPKSCFVRGAAALDLQAVQGGWQGDHIALTHPDRPDIQLDPATQGAQLIAWLAPLWPADKPAPTRLVRGPGIWTDDRAPYVSILSLTSLAALSSDLGKPLEIERWRGNLWVDGWAPWAERDLIGQTIRIGPVELRVAENIARCVVPGANPATGKQDVDMLSELSARYGHTDFGIFAEVVSGGKIAIGDEVSI
ncbi:MAG: MOSC domain-containing protein [Paracoccus sp. (in: a-proteobacteria)]|uniref:MOSC domain-containing protein n=1 Tax=Paracoccus sp. TaxID=267 RepID=UPI0026E0D7EA|nr:MOSC domain-containing protein [Paracoccus sp. (in: a-proteobacteria)]MDO5613613.1 MOSC domain-containing protein [Paracoccus sp. (in: a-proteobacteria)]